MSDNKPMYYASIMGKLPRKRKIERFEVNMQQDSTPYSAIKALQKLVKESTCH